MDAIIQELSASIYSKKQDIIIMGDLNLDIKELTQSPLSPLSHLNIYTTVHEKRRHGAIRHIDYIFTTLNPSRNIPFLFNDDLNLPDHNPIALQIPCDPPEPPTQIPNKHFAKALSTQLIDHLSRNNLSPLFQTITHLTRRLSETIPQSLRISNSNILKGINENTLRSLSSPHFLRNF